jgi:hypothetical protein
MRYGFKSWKQTLAKMQGKTAHIRPKVVRPFSKPCTSGSYVHQASLYRPFPRTLRKRELHAPSCPFFIYLWIIWYKEKNTMYAGFTSLFCWSILVYTLPYMEIAQYTLPYLEISQYTPTDLEICNPNVPYLYWRLRASQAMYSYIIRPRGSVIQPSNSTNSFLLHVRFNCCMKHDKNTRPVYITKMSVVWQLMFIFSTE